MEADLAAAAPQAPQARLEQLEPLEQQVLLEVCKLHCTVIVPHSPPCNVWHAALSITSHDQAAGPPPVCSIPIS